MNKIKKIIENNYNLKIKKIIPVEIQTLNNTFILETNKGKIFGKELFKFVGTTKEEFLSQIDIVKHLKKKKFKTIYPIENKKGEMLTVEGNNFYILYPYHRIDKVTKKSKEKNFEDIPRLLAEFHEATKDFKQKHIFSTTPAHKKIDAITGFTETPFDSGHEPIIRIAEKSNRKLAKRVLKDAPMIKEGIIKAVHFMWNGKYTRKNLLHYDASPNNVFYNNGAFIALSDFDYSHIGYIEMDIIRAAKFWSEREDGTLDYRKIKRFIYNYQKYAKCSSDWELYRGLLLFFVIRRIIYACDYTLNNRSELEFFYDKDIKALKQLMENKL